MSAWTPLPAISAIPTTKVAVVRKAHTAPTVASDGFFISTAMIRLHQASVNQPQWARWRRHTDLGGEPAATAPRLQPLRAGRSARRRRCAARAARRGRPRSSRSGEALGGEPLEWGRLANEHPPVLRTHDRYGERIDEVEFHPAWDSLLRLGLEARLHSLPWVTSRPGRARRAGGALHAARPGRGRRGLPTLDDVRRRPCAARRTRRSPRSGFRA